jgi:predicted transposase YbfD/YdcC
MDTVRRIIERLHPEGLAALMRPVEEPAGGPRRLSADGRSARGSRTRTCTAAHLLAVIDQDDQVIAQLRIPDKTNEIPCLREVLAPLGIEGAWASADALHTQTGTARFLAEEKKAHYLLTVKLNQPGLDPRRNKPWLQEVGLVEVVWAYPTAQLRRSRRSSRRCFRIWTSGSGG